MAERAEDFIVVCFHNQEGFGEEVGPSLMELVEIAGPDHWEFIKPGTVLAYFRDQGRSRKSAKSLVFSIESLQARDVRYRILSVGQAQGRMIAEIDFWGKVRSAPMGSVVGKAIEAARQKTGPVSS